MLVLADLSAVALLNCTVFHLQPAFAKAAAGEGGGEGIRTLDTLSSIHTFQACQFNHSCTPPGRMVAKIIDQSLILKHSFLVSANATKVPESCIVSTPRLKAGVTMFQHCSDANPPQHLCSINYQKCDGGLT